MPRWTREAQGVLSHELSDIKKYDIRLLLVVTTLIGVAGLLANVLWRSTLFRWDSSRGLSSQARGQSSARGDADELILSDVARAPGADRPPR
jgi:Zn-dependent protease with chaperone function